MTTPPRFSIVATDLDGTLLRADRTVSLRTRAALARVQAYGGRHLVVTGRPAAGCRSLLRSLDYQGLAVCGQGAQLYDATTDQLLSTARLDRPTVRALVNRIVEAVGPLEFGVVPAGPTGEFLVTSGFGRRVRHGWLLVQDPAELWARPVEKVLIRARRLNDDDLAACAAHICADRVTVTHSGEGMVELLPAGVSKANGLAAAARLLGFSAVDTIAFGDMPNDIPMLDWAGHGVAVANAHPDVRDCADEIAPSNEEDGVATVLERLFPPLTHLHTEPGCTHAPLR